LRKEERRKERTKNLKGPLPFIWKLVVNTYDKTLDYTKFILPISIFSFKFLEWWYSSEDQLLYFPKPIPPPPPPPEVLKKKQTQTNTYTNTNTNINTNTNKHKHKHKHKHK